MSIPNLLSLFRLLLVPVFPLVFFLPRPDARVLAVAVYLVAFVTDIADGWIARHFNQVTQLGPIKSSRITLAKHYIYIHKFISEWG